MDLIHSMHPLARAWLLDGPLSSFVDAFQALLERGRYAEGSSAAALRGWSHFAHWMTKCQLSAEQIDEALVGRSWIRICRAATAIPRLCAHAAN